MFTGLPGKDIDFVTSPGYLTGKGAREVAGLPLDGGPYKVITDLCVLGFEEESRWMQVECMQPGVTRDQIIENTGFELLWSPALTVSEAPTEDELRILREKVDPYRYIIGRS